MATRQIDMTDAAIESVRQSAYALVLPSLRRKTRDNMVSPNDRIREGYRLKGRSGLHFLFFMVYDESSGGVLHGSTPGKYGMVESAVLCDAVFREMLKKPCLPEGERIANESCDVTGPMYIYFGGLWEEAGSIQNLLPLAAKLFGPLIRAAVSSQRHPHPPTKKARIADNRRVGEDRPTEIAVLQRMLDTFPARENEFITAYLSSLQDVQGSEGEEEEDTEGKEEAKEKYYEEEELAVTSTSSRAYPVHPHRSHHPGVQKGGKFGIPGSAWWPQSSPDQTANSVSLSSPISLKVCLCPFPTSVF
ncbi:hypothetical protein C8R43DRAFT_1052336 [Mycena crocata]|nr:hypothetical protein C8R43DRAFT_1052336 [Mycena crocata]